MGRWRALSPVILVVVLVAGHVASQDEDVHGHVENGYENIHTHPNNGSHDHVNRGQKTLITDQQPKGEVVGHRILHPENPDLCPLGCKGDAGVKGTPGPRGRAGQRGSAGEAGEPGYGGWAGWPATEYAAARARAVKGDVGSPGDAGATGMDGNPGSTGVPGPQGPPGNSGRRGEGGVKGSTGLFGIPGRIGQAGLQGPRGEPGLKGAAGNDGLLGYKGDIGSVGAHGPDGLGGVPGLDGLPGFPGAKGVVGPRGGRGDRGSKGSTGEIGDPGFLGETGATGLVGDAGERGAKGIVGFAGGQGIVGDSGNQGASGEYGPNIMKVTIEDAGPCNQAMSGRTLYDPDTQKLFFCTNGQWQCVKDQACNQDCVLSEWSVWGECSTSCGSGTRYRLRDIMVKPGPLGAACPQRWGAGDCNLMPCTCEDQPALANGRRVVQTGNTIGDVAEWDCDPGFRLDGRSDSICHLGAGADKPTFTRQPICRVPNCPRIRQFANGRVQQDSRPTPQSTAKFSCRANFMLRGEETLLCQADGTWNYPVPVCVPLMCQDPGSPANGGRTASSFEINSAVRFHCNEGFELIGQSVSRCLSGGTYASDPPTCSLINCGTPQRPSRGRVSFTTTTYASIARFSCNMGYTMTGAHKAVCEGNGQWSMEPPVCRLVDCGDPGRVANGARTVQATTFGSRATFRCQAGFLLNGNEERICMATGLWSGSLPYCRSIDCGEPPVVANAAAVLNRPFTYPSGRVSYDCESGYALRGDRTLTCQASGRWSSDPPRCEVVDCGDVAAPANGDRYVTMTTLGSQLTYHCHTGYALAGMYSRVCQPNGQWNGQMPSCVVVDCGDPGAPNNGRVISFQTPAGQSPYSYQGAVTFSCKEGYMLRGAATRTCTACGEWSDSMPLCVPMECPNLNNLRNGDTDMANRSVQTSISFQCDPGFNLVGERNLRCGTDTAWTAQPPLCEPTQCAPLKPIANGAIFSDSNFFGDIATVTCNAGYKLQGSETRTCEENMEWSGVDGICSLVDCGTPDDVANAIVTGAVTTYGSSLSYNCNEGYNLMGSITRDCMSSGMWSGSAPTCVQIVCPNPGVLPNGDRTPAGALFAYKADVRYSCNAGFRLSGAEVRSCGGDGMWSAAAPSCVPLMCTDPGVPEFGSRLLSTLQIGATVDYACNTGYTLRGAPSATCQATSTAGVWSTPRPTCEIVDCGDPGRPENGDRALSTTTFGSTVQYVCKSGYDLVGGTVRTCLATGQWTGAIPQCQLIDCGTPGEPLNGARQGDNFLFEDVVTYTCDAGFELRGVTTQRCQANSQWSDQPPICTRLTCANPGLLANGQRVGDDFSQGATVSYSCNAGFQLVGQATRTCDSSGVFSGSAPSCVALACEEPGVPENGDRLMSSLLMGSQVSFTCNTGFAMNGSPSITCEASESGTQWSAAHPTCVAITCGDPEFGVWDGSRTSYTAWRDFECQTGFMLSGSSSRRCTEDGSFSGSGASCSPIDCGSLNTPAGGSVSIRPSTSFGGVARYTCSAGYQLVGASTRTCQAGGFWSGSEPFCVQIRCPNPGFPAYSTRTSIVDDNVFNPADTVAYSCQLGYFLTGQAVLTCGNNGAWSHSTPTCVAHVCADPGPLANGDRQMSSRFSGARVSYTCNVGFALQGSPTQRCVVNEQNTGATWSTAQPSCDPIACPPTPDIENGQWTYDTTSKVYMYTCNTGYRLVGNSARMCLLNGDLSGEVPSCEVIDCGSPPSISNGLLRAATTVYGSRASYSCDTGYRLSGSALRTCQADGLWSGSMASCVIVDCGNPGSPAHGNRVNSDVFTFEATASFNCDPGYQMVGEQSITCQADGTWSSAIPVCSILQCRDPGTPENGYHDLSSLTVGSNVQFTCHVGYTLIGAETLECIASADNTAASWNAQVPACRIVDCGEVAVPARGQRMGNVFTYGSSVSFSCQVGYAIQGSVSRLCQASGLWSGVQPTCQVVNCGNPENIENGNPRFTTTIYNSVVSHTCRAGYVLTGDQRRTCQADGLWSGAAPQCLLVSCGNPGIPPYGTRNGDEFTFNSDVQYACNNGYRLEGSSSARCTAAGTWSSALPTCVRLDCRDPGTPANGDRALSNTLVGATVNYTCNVGYVLRGAGQRACNPTPDGRNAAWSASLPTCAIVDCGRQEAPANGRMTGNIFTYGSLISFTCNAGYALSGSEYRTCQATGLFSGTAASCVVVDCLDPGTPQNGGRSGTLTTYNNVFSFNCNPGYTLFGSSSRTCTASGAWSGSQPTCHIVDCGDPGTPSNGDRSDSLTTYLSTMSFTCRNGYVLAGSSERQCLATGEWSGQETRCVAIVCVDPDVPANGGRDGDSFIYNAEVKFFCNPGYRLVGEVMRTCRANGLFDLANPICQLISCGDPGTPEFGSREGDVFTYNSEVAFACQEGYKLVNSQRRLCQTDGDWSGIQPSCSPIICRELFSPANGGLRVTNRGYQGQALYTCDTGYYLVGATTRVCEANELWSESMPECRIVECCSVEAPANGQVIVDTITYQSVSSFTCNSGFNLLGSQVRTCQADGTWTGIQPSCERGMCVDPGTPLNGQKVTYSYAVGGAVDYACNTGYRLLGQQKITCQPDETWSHPVPVCEIIDCGVPDSVVHGSHNGSSFTFGQVVGYTCEDAYTRNGPATVRCSRTGMWSPPGPTCDANCIVGPWSAYGACSVTCGDGARTRSRVVLQQPLGIGRACPIRSEQESCNPRSCVSCNGFAEGHIAFRIRTQEIDVATDVIIVVDESFSMEGEHVWLPGMIENLERELKAKQIGASDRLPNMYCLVGFGQASWKRDLLYPHRYNTSAGEGLFPQSRFAQVAGQLHADVNGSVEDGYLAIQHGLNNCPLRTDSRVTINTIFISDEDRDILSPEGSSLTRGGIKTMLKEVRSKGSLLNVVVDNNFYCGGVPVLGVDSNSRGFQADGRGQYTTCPRDAIPRGYGSTKRDYTGPAVELDGAAWDIKLLRQGGDTANSFTRAFTDVKTAEITRQVDLCRRCVCTDDGATGSYACAVEPQQDECTCKANGNSFVNGQCVTTPTG